MTTALHVKASSKQNPNMPTCLIVPRPTSTWFCYQENGAKQAPLKLGLCLRAIKSGHFSKFPQNKLLIKVFTFF